MTRRALVKRVEKAAMQLFENAYAPKFPLRDGRRGIWQHDGLHGFHDNAFGKACAALAAHDRRKKNG